MGRVLYEINTHVWLREQPWSSARRPRLSDIPDSQLGQWAAMGIEGVWLLGVWKKGQATRRICLEHPDLRSAFEQILPDLREEDVIGSPFSIAEYRLDPALGEESDLAQLRARLHAHGLRLILDFVPNHLAVDHAWTESHPERFVQGSEGLLQKEPRNYFRVAGHPDRILAHGRDPYFSGWTDTAQINIFNRDARQALLDLLLGVSEVCDGVRCDMAMLVTNNVFARTWGDLSVLDYPEERPAEFWEEAIAAVRRRHPDFLFLAEVYWGLERELQRMGFDLTYDKRLYDLVRSGEGAGIREHLSRTQECQNALVRFLENHDEGRAAEVLGPRQKAAAVLLTALPGATLYHEGQFEGRRSHLPVQLGRRPWEACDEDLLGFYRRLLETSRQAVMHHGEFRLPYVREAWEGNPSHRVIVTCWRRLDMERRLIVSNIGPHQAQAYTEVFLEGLECPVVEFRDLMGPYRYYRSREELLEKGLYLDIASGQYHVFEVRAAPAGVEADAV